MKKKEEAFQNNKQITPQNVKYKKTLIIISLMCFAVIGLFIANQTIFASNSDFEVVATVNGDAIVEREMRNLAGNLKAEVQNDFQVNHGAKLTKEFWTNHYDGENPFVQLKEKTLTEAIKRKIELTLAMNNKLIDFNSYNELLTQLDMENERREKAIKKGEIVYGLRSFSENQYEKHIISNMRLRLKDFLSKKEGDPLYVTEKELQKSFSEHQDQWSGKNYMYNIQKIEINYTSSDEMNSAEQKALQALTELESGKNFEEVAKKYNKDKKLLSHTLSSESSRGAAQAVIELRTGAESLELNQYSKDIIHVNGSYNIIKLISKANEEGNTFQENYDSIKKMVVDEKYEEYINRLIEEAEVTVNKESYNELNLLEMD
jgi:hypothetical protein